MQFKMEQEQFQDILFLELSLLHPTSNSYLGLEAKDNVESAR